MRIALALGALMAAPARIGIECAEIRAHSMCAKQPHCSWPEVNWGRQVPPPAVRDEFGVARRIRGEHCEQTHTRRQIAPASLPRPLLAMHPGPQFRNLPR
jgi:hypothetical protein